MKGINFPLYSLSFSEGGEKEPGIPRLVARRNSSPKKKQSHFGLVAYVADLLIEPDTSSTLPLHPPLSLLFRDTLESAVRNSTRIDNAPAISRPIAKGEGISIQGGEKRSNPPSYGKRKKRPVPVKGMNINRGPVANDPAFRSELLFPRMSPEWSNILYLNRSVLLEFLAWDWKESIFS